VRVPFSLKNCLVFGPYRPEKEICYFNKNGKFKFQIDLDRHGPRPLLNHRHFTEPPTFSLYTTFKVTFQFSLKLPVPKSKEADAGKGRNTMIFKQCCGSSFLYQCRSDPGSKTNADTGGSGSWADFIVKSPKVEFLHKNVLKVGNKSKNIPTKGTKAV